VRRPGGKIVSFNPPESLGTFPVSINDAGAITGSYIVPGGRIFGLVRDPQGKFTSFDPGALTTQPTMRSGINNEGAITGTYAGVGVHGFVRSPDGTITSFDAPTFCMETQANPTSINDEGVITGLCGLTRFPGQPSWVRFP
jgi:hypothetical protein